MTESRIHWVAEDPASLSVLELARKVADTTTTLLITGESGTGKDLLARLIHELGPRRDHPFLKIECATLPPELVESELFGHEAGAFTGAVEQKLGRLELAQGGTIALDEIAAVAPSVQAKLLRVLEDRTFEHLGGVEPLRMTSRLIAITNADLPRAIEAGTFREDLYFRINVLSIAVPPLRERPGDILPLMEYLLGRLGTLHGHPGTRFNPDATRILQTYQWPGNVRELKNVIERALVFARHQVLTPADLPEGIRNHPGATPPSEMASLEDVERETIRRTLEATRYKIGKTAEILGITRKTLLDKRKKYGLD